jgi:hypothetical protein
MTKTYNIDNSMGQEVIWYEKDGVRYSFITDPANSDYQRYLNPEVEHLTGSNTQLGGN